MPEDLKTKVVLKAALDLLRETADLLCNYSANEHKESFTAAFDAIKSSADHLSRSLIDASEFPDAKPSELIELTEEQLNDIAERVSKKLEFKKELKDLVF